VKPVPRGFPGNLPNFIFFLDQPGMNITENIQNRDGFGKSFLKDKILKKPLQAVAYFFVCRRRHYFQLDPLHQFSGQFFEQIYLFVGGKGFNNPGQFIG